MTAGQIVDKGVTEGSRTLDAAAFLNHDAAISLRVYRHARPRISG
jgi:hypothetical protein